jgi:hypothetical protein
MTKRGLRKHCLVSDLTLIGEYVNIVTTVITLKSIIIITASITLKSIIIITVSNTK